MLFLLHQGKEVDSIPSLESLGADRADHTAGSHVGAAARARGGLNHRESPPARESNHPGTASGRSVWRRGPLQRAAPGTARRVRRQPGRIGRGRPRAGSSRGEDNSAATTRSGHRRW